jgi:hypothetical protein
VKRELCVIKRLAIPFGEVRSFLKPNPLRFLQPAAEAGIVHVGEILATLEVRIAGLHFERLVLVAVGPSRETHPSSPLLRIPVRWHAVDHPERYPLMDACLEAFPIPNGSTQLAFQGSYRPPFGAVGTGLDNLFLHRIAEESVNRFLDAVVDGISEAFAA